MAFFVFPDNFLQKNFPLEATALNKALLVEFSKYCKDKNHKNSVNFTFDKNQAGLWTSNESAKSHIDQNLIVERQPESSSSNESFLVHLITYFESIADLIDTGSLSAILHFSMMYIGCSTTDPMILFKEEFHERVYFRKGETDAPQQIQVLLAILNLLGLCQKLRDDNLEIRKVITKIRNFAFNENLVEVFNLASCLVLEFELESQFNV